MNQMRLEKVLQEMKKNEIPQLLVSDPAAIFYLTGKWIHPGERMLTLQLTTKGERRLFINELFPIREDIGAEKIWFNDTQDPIEILTRHVDAGSRIGVDKNWPARFLLPLMQRKGDSNIVNGSAILDRIRMCKDDEEKELMRKASLLNDKAVEKMIALVPGQHSEKKMGQLLQGIYEELGADGCSFSPIIAYGANAANPHHDSDNTVAKPGDSVIIDIGCVKDSYCADMTRTVFYKSVSELSRKIYQIVLDANLRAIEAVKPGVRFCDIDRAARGYIEEAGYGKFFTHRTGHSIGLEVHDFGDVSAVNTDPVAPGMIFSIEPGIYLPGEVGVRIEDLVLVTETGCEILNHYSKELTVVG